MRRAIPIFVPVLALALAVHVQIVARLLALLQRRTVVSPAALAARAVLSEVRRDDLAAVLAHEPARAHESTLFSCASVVCPAPR